MAHYGLLPSLALALAVAGAAPNGYGADDPPTTVAESPAADASNASETIKRDAREVGDAVKRDAKVVGEAVKRDAKVVGKAVAEGAKTTAKVATEDAKKVGKAARAGADSAKNTLSGDKVEKSDDSAPR